jgi:hypothetical protein
MKVPNSSHAYYARMPLGQLPQAFNITCSIKQKFTHLIIDRSTGPACASSFRLISFMDSLGRKWDDIIRMYYFIPSHSSPVLADRRAEKLAITRGDLLLYTARTCETSFRKWQINVRSSLPMVTDHRLVLITTWLQFQITAVVPLISTYTHRTTFTRSNLHHRTRQNLYRHEWKYQCLWDCQCLLSLL